MRRIFSSKRFCVLCIKIKLLKDRESAKVSVTLLNETKF